MGFTVLMSTAFHCCHGNSHQAYERSTASRPLQAHTICLRTPLLTARWATSCLPPPPLSRIGHSCGSAWHVSTWAYSRRPMKSFVLWGACREHDHQNQKAQGQGKSAMETGCAGIRIKIWALCSMTNPPLADAHYARALRGYTCDISSRATWAKRCHGCSVEHGATKWWQFSCAQGLRPVLQH